MKFATLALIIATASAQDTTSPCFEKAILDYQVYTDKDCKNAKEGGMMDSAKKTTWTTAANTAYGAVKETCTGTDTAGAGYAKKTCVKDKSVTIQFYSDKDCKTELTTKTDLDTVKSDAPFSTAAVPSSSLPPAVVTYGSCVANGDKTDEWIKYTDAKAIGASILAATIAVAATLY